MIQCRVLYLVNLSINVNTRKHMKNWCVCELKKETERKKDFGRKKRSKSQGIYLAKNSFTLIAHNHGPEKTLWKKNRT